MIQNRIVLLGALLAAAMFAAPPAMADGDGEGDDAEFVVGEAVVELEEGADIAVILAQPQFEGVVVIGSIASLNIHLLSLPPTWDEDMFETAFEDEPGVEDADLNDEVETVEGHSQSFFMSISETEYEDQYVWPLIGLETAHATSTGDGVVVAVVDTGVDVTHPDLAGQVLGAGFDFVDGDADVSEPVTGTMAGHGTFAAGLVLSVAPDASILPVRVLDGNGEGTAFRVAQGIAHALEQGADIINLGLGYGEQNDIVTSLLLCAQDAGVVVVSAIGNLNEADPDVHPAVDPMVIAVAATDADDRKSPFSNYGEDVSISAPGSDVGSTLPGGVYGQWSGTSMAAALVSGAAAVVKAQDPLRTPAEIEALLGAAAVNIDAANPAEYEGQLGAGRLDVAAALGVEPAPADLDGSGAVDIGDLLILLGEWGLAGSPADLDGSGVVDVGDLLLILAAWG